MHLPFPLSTGGGGHEPPTKFSKQWGLTESQSLEGVAGKERVTFFKGGAVQFLQKKLKLDIFNNKKSL